MKNDDYLLDAVLEEVRIIAESQGKGVIDILMEKCVVTEAQVVRLKAAQFGAECAEDYELDHLEPIIARLPAELSPAFFKQSRMVPIAISDTKIVFATSEPSNFNFIDEVCLLAGLRELRIKVASERAIKAALIKYLGLTDVEYAESLKASEEPGQIVFDLTRQALGQ